MKKINIAIDDFDFRINLIGSFTFRVCQFDIFDNIVFNQITLNKDIINIKNKGVANE